MEDEIGIAETGRDVPLSEGESSMNMSNNSPTKRARGRPKGSKKLQVCVTDVNLMELVSDISNGGSKSGKRGRGRPRVSEKVLTDDDLTNDSANTLGDEESKNDSESKKQASDEDHSPKKKGKPKRSLTNLSNGGSDAPKRERGRPKGSMKRSAQSVTSGEEDEGSAERPRKRGRPKGSFNKKPRLERRVSSTGQAADGNLSSPKRGRGRPRKEGNSIGSMQNVSNGFSKKETGVSKQESKNQEESTYSSQPTKRGKGRPKGSLNKKPPAYVHKAGRPQRDHVPPARLEAALPKKRDKRGRPRKIPAKRGRPRKYPLPSPEELKKPKVWKPLGRPRKYPRVDPPEGAQPVTRRSRGRPRKAESKKGAHLRKSTSASSTRVLYDGTPRKRGRPPGTAKSQDGTVRKRGRPKGSVNKSKVIDETQLSKSNDDDEVEREGDETLEEQEGPSVDEAPVQEEGHTELTTNEETLTEEDAE